MDIERRSVLRKIFNGPLISRFFAKQVDLVLVHLAAFGLYTINLSLAVEYVLHPLGYFLISLVLFTAIEALMIFYFKTTVGKFILGLRVYPLSLKDSFKRSFGCYVFGVGMGIPLVGWLLAGYQYLRGINRGISWDKYAPVEQTWSNLIKGLIIGTVFHLAIIAIFVTLYFVQNPGSKATGEGQGNSKVIEKVIVDYPVTEEEADEILSDTEKLWEVACMAGIYGTLEYYKIAVADKDIGVVVRACAGGKKRFLNLDDEPEIIFFKACGFGVGVGRQMAFPKEKTLKDEKILKKVCFPNVDF